MRSYKKVLIQRILCASQKVSQTRINKGFDETFSVIRCQRWDYIAEIANRQLQEDGVTEWHEIWHMRQAENFRKEVGKITAENYVKYIEYAIKKGKKHIDALGITEYNVKQISAYAEKMYFVGRYDEVEAEYAALHRKEQSWN